MGWSQNTNIRITQIYYNGGIDAGASYANDFVELYNDSDQDLDLNGQYALAVAPNGWQKILTGVIPARRFFLVQYASWFNGGAELPTPDFVGASQDLDGGKRVMFYYDPDGQFFNPILVDDVDFRSSVSLPAPTTDSSTLAVRRKRSGALWQDTDVHANDFQLGAPDPHNSLYVAKTTPTVTWGTVTGLTYPAPLSTNQLNATCTVAGTFAYVPTPGSVLNAGTNPIVATFTPADTNAHNPPAPITNFVVVSKGNQTISFAALAGKAVGEANFDLSASANSGLAVVFASDNTNVLFISGSNAMIKGPGTTVVTASQPGNANWNAASNVPRALTVQSRFAAWAGSETMTPQSVKLYAIGGASGLADLPVQPVSGISGGNLTLTAIIRTNDPKLTVTGETGTNLSSWTQSGVTIADSPDTHGVPLQHARKIFSVPQTTNGPKFLRLKATLNP